jgi:hypothetical protein
VNIPSRTRATRLFVLFLQKKKVLKYRHFILGNRVQRQIMYIQGATFTGLPQTTHKPQVIPRPRTRTLKISLVYCYSIRYAPCDSIEHALLLKFQALVLLGLDVYNLGAGIELTRERPRFVRLLVAGAVICISALLLGRWAHTRARR